jgi:surface protein
MKILKLLLLLVTLGCCNHGSAQNFITRWNLATAGSGATQLTFGVGTVGTVNYTWTTIPAASSGSGTFTGTNATITGLPAGATIQLAIQPTNFRRFNMNSGLDKSRLLQVEQWGTTLWSSMQTAFSGCNNLQVTATDIPNLTSVTNMSFMFDGCSMLNSPSNINTWNTGNITSMVGMFRNALAFNQPIDSWNTSSVTSMLNMFNNAVTFNQPIGTWNTSNVISMAGMFSLAGAFNQPIDAWNTSNVIYLDNMFKSATAFNQPIGTWNTGNVVYMTAMFRDAQVFNQPVGSWNTSNVAHMSDMFLDALAFNQPIGSWNTSNVTNMIAMFTNAHTFNQPIGTWNTSNVSEMNYMFANASSFNQSIGSWTLNANVTLNYMLDSCGMSCANYSETLIGWNSNPLTPNGRSLWAIGKTYGAHASADRANLVLALGSGGNGWTISDAGPGTINPIFSPVPSICSGDSISPLPTTSNNGISGTWLPAINNTVTTTYTFTPDFDQCGNSTDLTITVFPNMVVTSTNPNQIICVNTSISAINHSTLIATGIGAATGLPNGVSAIWNADVITISGTPTESGIFNYSIPLTGGCGTVFATGTITVNPDNIASIGSSAPSLCINTTLTDITHATAGATGIGTASELPSGVSATWNADVITISGTPTESGVFNYSIPLTDGCGIVVATGSISIDSCLSITENLNQSNFCIHPNPSNGIFKISTESSEDLIFEVYDLQGRLVYSVIKNLIEENLIDISKENNGVYLLKLKTKLSTAIIPIIKI